MHNHKDVITLQRRNVSDLYKDSVHQAVTNLHLSYKNQTVNAVQGKSHTLFKDLYTTHKCNVSTMQNFGTLNLMVHKLNTRL